MKEIVYIFGADVVIYFLSGVEVPSKDSMPKKKPVYSDKRKKKPIIQTPEGLIPTCFFLCVYIYL